MRISLRIILIFLIPVSVFLGCKKGEDDPVFSLRTRKARLVGDWVIQSGSVTSLTTTPSYTSNYSADYTSVSYKSTATSATKTQTQPIRTEDGLLIQSFSFKKNGDFSSEKHTEGYVYFNGINSGGQQDINTTEVEGTWNFTGDIGTRKKKDQLVITATSTQVNGTTTTYAGNKIYVTYNIKELRNKKLVLTRENSDDNGFNQTTFNETLILYKK